jgi:hypothetical protein
MAEHDTSELKHHHIPQLFIAPADYYYSDEEQEEDKEDSASETASDVASVVSSATIANKKHFFVLLFSELLIAEAVRAFDDELTELASGKAW